MLTTYTVVDGTLALRSGVQAPGALRAAVWLDLLNPSAEEERAVQDALRLEVPTREEMQEIESSSRLYREEDALFLTANFLYGVEEGEFGSTPISFVLSQHNLITVRYATPRAFLGFITRCQKHPPTQLRSADHVMLGLFEMVVDRLADILERVGSDMDNASRTAFRSAKGQARADRRDADLRNALLALGQVGEVTSRASETLLGLSRILTFLGTEKDALIRKENASAIKTLVRDLKSLVDHANFLSNKANFLLDAILGIIGIDQNGIIKTFTVASVAMMPPTLIASIYGMNFKFMPELDWHLGYPLAILVMIVSAILPVFYFKRKGWL